MSVIDIGANIGDSTLFFASKGYDVLAFEPIPEVYEIAIKNFSLNPDLSKKITLVNKAVSDKKGKISISYDSITSSTFASSFISSNSKSVVIDTITIKDIIQDYNINPHLLKLDCEGCEGSVILNSDLSMFKKIIFEYHTSATGIKHEKLLEKLTSEGFKITNHEVGEKDIVGTIHLEKDK